MSDQTRLEGDRGREPEHARDPARERPRLEDLDVDPDKADLVRGGTVEPVCQPVRERP